MAWIESHTTLVHHPKISKLARLTGWNHNECLGIMHRVWWWTLTYAEDGRLDEHLPEEISEALGLRLTDTYTNHNQLFKVLIDAKLMDIDLKIHNWLDYAGRYLKGKYRNSNPKRLLEISKTYKGKKRRSKDSPRVALKPDNRTVPYRTIPKEKESPEALRLAGVLADLILKHYENFRELQSDRKEKTITRWAEDIDKANRLDKRAWHEIEILIRWAQSDIFWRKNILSGQKLREQFDKLHLARKSDMTTSPESKDKRAKLETELTQLKGELSRLIGDAGYFKENPNHEKAEAHRRRSKATDNEIVKIERELEAMA